MSLSSFRYRPGGAAVRTGQFCPQGSGGLLQTDPISGETAQEHEAGERWPAEGTAPLQLHTSNASHEQSEKDTVNRKPKSRNGLVWISNHN